MQTKVQQILYPMLGFTYVFRCLVPVGPASPVPVGPAGPVPVGPANPVPVGPAGLVPVGLDSTCARPLYFNPPSGGEGN